MKKINILLLLVGLLTLLSCECPVKESEPMYLCETRIVTIEKFHPNFSVQTINGQTETVLDSIYSISLFQFPDNAKSSGSFPNDARFVDNMQIPVLSLPFSEGGTQYYAAIMDGFPNNETMNGDFLVSRIDTAALNSWAILRVSGSIAFFADNYASESASDFCNYAQSNFERIATIADNITNAAGKEMYIWGANQTNSTVTDYNASTIVVLDNNMKVITNNPPAVPANVTNELRTMSAGKRSVDLLVKPGEVYVYLAKNKKRFLVYFSEVRKSPIFPYRERLTMMFYPIDK